MPWAPTTTQILDCDGVRRRADDFRFDLFDDTDQLIGELHPDASRPPTVSNDTTRAVRRQLNSFHLPASELADIALTDRVRPVMVLQNGAEDRLGTFVLADRGDAYRQWGIEREATWSDRCIALNQSTEKTIGFGKGANIVIALLGVLQQVVPVTDIATAPESDAVFGAPVQWTPGTNRITILDTMTDLLGWLPLFFNRSGFVEFLDVPDLETAATELSYQVGTRIFDGSILTNDDLLDAPNKWVVYETSGRSTVTGSYSVPASAPHSAANRGFVVPEVSSVQGLGSTAAANKYAKSKALTGQRIYRWLNLNGPADYRHDTWNVVAALGETWLEIAWQLTCQSGAAMSHRLRRVY